jgi:tRNA-specific 2-thiouridylase
MKQEARKSFQDSQLITHNSLLTTHYLLLESIDKNKDQSYFLYTLNQEQLNHTLFPVGDLTKPEVRELAKKYGLSTAEKKDSQGLCFIGKIDMKVFLSHYIKTARGDVLNTSGEVIGWHPGSVLFAIGERHGFTITKKTSNDPRFFVIAKNLSLNTITVADKESETDETNGIKEVKLDKIHFLSGIMPTLPLKTTARVRYRQEKQECMILKESDGYRVYFNKPQDGVSAGQSIVFYDGELCLGGGIIEFA